MSTDHDGPTVILPCADEPLVIEVLLAGPPGASAPVNHFAIGEVATGVAGATITGEAPNQVLNLTLPDGAGPNTAAAAEMGATLAGLNAAGVTLRPSRILDFTGPAFFARRSMVTAALPVFLPAIDASFARGSVATFFAEDGALATAAVDAPRLATGLDSGLAEGLMLEGARANSIRNNGFRGLVPGVIGAGGVWPANWQNGGASGLTRTLSAPYVHRGMTCIDVRYQGVASDGGGYPLIFEPAAVIAAASGQTWTMSIYLALVAGSMANISSFRFYVPPQPSGSAAASGSIAPDITSALKRFSFGFSYGDAITHIQPRFAMNHSVGATIDFTLRVGMVQLEQGTLASSPIATTTGAVERAGETFARPRAGLGPATRVLAARAAAGISGNQVLWQADDGSDGNRHSLFRDGTGALRYRVMAAGAEQANLLLGTVADGAAFKVAIRMAASDFAGSLNGAAVVADTAGDLPSVTTERWGGGIVPGAEWWGTLARDIDYPAALANVSLQALSV